MPSIALNALLSAAANYPVPIVNGKLSFEKESFRRRALEFAESQGKKMNWKAMQVQQSHKAAHALIGPDEEKTCSLSISR